MMMIDDSSSLMDDDDSSSLQTMMIWKAESESDRMHLRSSSN